MTTDFSFKPERRGGFRRKQPMMSKEQRQSIKNARTNAKFNARRMFTVCQRCERRRVANGLPLCKTCADLTGVGS